MTTADRIRRADRELTWRLTALRAPRLVTALRHVGTASRHTKLWVGAAAVQAALGGRPGRASAFSGLLSLGVTQVLCNALAKQAYDRDRPPRSLVRHGDIAGRPGSSSFPSGHVAAATAYTSAVALRQPAVGAALTVPAALVAVQRVQSGAHYGSDVLAGAVIGVLCTALTRRAPALLGGSGGPRRSLSRPGARGPWPRRRAG
ncbi:phosphatase PAP2 family protein [Streptomyces sp. TRM 70351]|uniref:phosphatase PAP2 family protein n=1 Tax=Streptomyces sp. TRM 70351 TaxID=3116552 RepID=UPI002E7BA1C3|nr:phosphatase PAP2 family protein [Streptomyces sp. TRM 70351]MEE1927122.1 phosphatase PAP2 family protein [Streptomyces sp. TRM 70351]